MLGLHAAMKNTAAPFYFEHRLASACVQEAKHGRVVLSSVYFVLLSLQSHSSVGMTPPPQMVIRCKHQVQVRVRMFSSVPEVNVLAEICFI